MIKKILNKVVLVLIGLLLALILLEMSMWIAGFTISSYQKYKNDRALKNKSQYTVMCIGESTTAGQYTLPLKSILTTKYPTKFSPIDCGIIGTHLETILELLDDNITKYKPDITICMMGINDGLIFENNEEYLNDIKNNKIQNKIKIYKLYLLLKEHIKSLIKTKEILADNIDMPIYTKSELQKAIEFFHKGEYISSEQILLKILKNDPYNLEARFYLVEIYFYHLPGYKKRGYELSLKAINMNIQFFRTHFYKKIIEYNIEINNIKQAKQFIDQLINEENIELDIHLYGTIKKLLTPKQKEKALQKILFADKDKTYGTLAIDYMEQKDYAKADKYFDMAEQLRLNFPSKKTSKLYRAIIKKLVDNNIKVICMQYPVRSIKPLQNILKDTDYYDKITFISNEKTFKQVLKEKSFDVIFADQFAGDFGHCTEYGNTLIAENVVKTLIDLTN